MFRVINEYMSKLNINTDDEIFEKVEAFFKDEEVKSHSVNISFNRYIVDIHLVDYSIDIADGMFRRFVDATAYPYSHITVRYNEKNRVRYRYVTCKENKNGVYMDVIIS